jgi:lysozyme
VDGDVTIGAQALADAADLVAGFEAFCADVYMDSGGTLTLGYGSTRMPDGSPVTRGCGPITKTVARAWLEADLAARARKIEQWIPPGATDNQCIAILSLCYNEGVEALRTSSLLKLWELGQIEAAAAQFDRWVFVRGRVSQGLVTRRTIEKALFLGPPSEADVLNQAELDRIRGQT